MKTLLIMVLVVNSYNALANQEAVIKDIIELENKLVLPPSSFETLIKIESGFNSNIINRHAPVSSYGIGQLTLASAKLCGLTRKTILNYKKNLECSAQLFKSKFKKYDDLNKAVVAYNEGTPCICENGKFKRDLGIRKLSCNDPKHRKCVDGELLETKYLKLFKQSYIDEE